MTSFKSTVAFSHKNSPKIGILLANLGTPSNSSTSAVRTYLKEFLSDPRVVEIPSFVWWWILHLFILPFRSPKSAAKYQQIWTEHGSPLLVNSQKQTHLFKGYIGEKLRVMGFPSDCVHTELAMRYGEPSISSALANLKKIGCQKILVIPLYPQYAASTTASVNDAVFKELSTWRWQPALRTIDSYHDFQPYIHALAESVRNHWKQHGKAGILVMSFHGVPKFSLDKGDPYHCLCQKTARLLAEELKLDKNQYRVSFQSRFGKTEWLQPYTTATLQKLANEKVERVDLICPGFVSDCLETLEEIAMEGKHDFLSAGGKEYHYIPALNDSPTWIHALTDLCIQELGGWLQTPPSIESLTATETRAKEMGANA